MRLRARRRRERLAEASRGARAPTRIVAAALVAVVAWGMAPTRRASGDEAASAATSLLSVTLEDPSSRRWSLAELAGHPVLLVVADRAGSRAAVAWGERIAAVRGDRVALWAEPDKVVVVSIADVRGVPSFARSVARWTIARMTTDDAARAGRVGPPLLLDWEGDVAAPIGAQPGVPSLRLLALDGRVAARIDGEANDERVAEMVLAIDRALAPLKPAEGPAAVPEP